MPTLYLTATRTPTGWLAECHDEASPFGPPIASHEAWLRSQAELRCQAKAEAVVGEACRWVEDGVSQDACAPPVP